MSIISKNIFFQLKWQNPATSQEASVTNTSCDAAGFCHFNWKNIFFEIIDMIPAPPTTSLILPSLQTAITPPIV